MDPSTVRAVPRQILRLAVPAVLVAAAYCAWMKATLERTLNAAGVGARSVRFEASSPSRSALRTWFPFVIRAAVKRLDAQNWVPDGDRGLLDRKLAWSPGAFRWLDDSPAPLPLDEFLDLKALSLIPFPYLLDALDDASAHRREVAGQELLLRTGRDLGYRHDSPPERRAPAIAAWRRFWELNRVRYSAGRVEEKLEQVFRAGGAEAPEDRERRRTS